MSKLYMTTEADNRQPVTRCGHKQIITMVNAWNVGVTVEAEVDKGIITFHIYKNRGSNDSNCRELIQSISDVEER